MEKSMKLKILESVGKVYEKSAGCELENSFLKRMDRELFLLSDYFKTTQIQSFFIATVFAFNYKGDTVNINNLINYYNCNPMKLLQYNDDFEYLFEKGIFDKKRSHYSTKLAKANDQFIINEKIAEAIFQNQPMPETQHVQMIDIIDLLEKLYNLGHQRDLEELTTHELFSQTQNLLADHLHFPLIKWISVSDLNISESYVYLYSIWTTLMGEDIIDIYQTMGLIYERPSTRIREMQKLILRKSKLIKSNLLELVASHFASEMQMKLSAKSINMLQEYEIIPAIKKKKNNIILPSDIQTRELVYSEAEMKQLFLLKDTLKEEKFTEVQLRLMNKGLPKGITVLLHGVPGTGKTETVKQLAKETQREIMKIEISQSKSMWFGESEKLIKRIFTDYKQFSKECEQTPILLFNEADAIIARRRDIGSSGISQTENAIQNILLEELENFEGILIATTNLVSNLDTAFERRFLFKIEFQNPGTIEQIKIWKMKLPHLTNEECRILAAQFDFSGGQIDNIARKNEIQEIVYGNTVTFNNLMSFCKEEKLNNSISKIGYMN